MTTLANLTTYLSAESAQFVDVIEKSKAGLRSLVKELDPAAAATDKFNRQQAELDKGLKRGNLTLEQHTTLVGRLRTRYDENIASLTKLNGVTGSVRAGQQQLAFQFGDIATQASSGTPLVQIFGQQIFQVIGALQLMQKESKGLIGFLGGPWGSVVTGAVVLLTPLVLKLFDAAEASKAAKDALEELGKAVDDIGTFFDRQTGKIKETNAALLQYAILSRDQRIAQSWQQQEAARVKGRQALASTLRDQNPVFVERGLGRNQVKDINFDVQKLFANGPNAPGIDEGLRAIAASKSSNAALAKQILEQRALFAKSGEEVIRLQKEQLSLRTGVLDPSLRTGKDKADRKTREPRDRGAQQLERYTRELQSLQDEELGLRGQLTEDVGQQAKLEHERLAQSTEAYATELAARVQQKELTQAQADSLLAQRQINDQKRNTLINWKLDDQLLQQDVTQKRAALDNQAALLQGELQMARTAEERRRLQLELLDIDSQKQRLGLEAIIAMHAANDAEKKNAQDKLNQLGREQGQAAAQINRQNAGPLAQYLDGIPRTAAEINESFENIAADGLAQLNDGLAQALMGSKSLGDVFSNVTDQILADILRIVIQQQLIKPLASLLSGGGGGGGGGFDPLNLGSLGLGSKGKGGDDWLSGIGGKSGGGFNLFKSVGKLIGFANGGSFQIGGKGGIDQNVLSINGIPRAMVSASELVNITPGSDRRGGGGTQVFDMRGALVTEELLEQVNQIASSRAATVVGGYAKRQARSARQNLNYGGGM